MTKDQQSDLFDRWLAIRDSDPRRFDRLVSWWLAGGIAYVVGLGLLSLFVAIGSLVLLFLSDQMNAGAAAPLLLAILILYTLFRSCRTKIPPSEGVPLSRSQFPSLYAFLEPIEKALKVRVDEVIVSDAVLCSASVFRRNGLFGRPICRLNIGWDEISAVTKENFVSSCLYYLCDVSVRYSPTLARLNCEATTWRFLADSIHANRFIPGRLFFFLPWYVDRLQTLLDVYLHQTYGKRLAFTSTQTQRENEINSIARTAAYQELSARRRSTAFLPTNLTQDSLPIDTFWTQTIQFSKLDPETLRAALRSHFRVGNLVPDSEVFFRQVQDVLRVSQEELIEAAGENIELPTAAQALFGESHRWVAEQLALTVQKRLRMDWVFALDELLRKAHRREVLLTKEKTEPLTVSERAQLAAIALDLNEKELAKTLALECRAEDPSNPEAMLALGKVLADEQNAECVPLLQACSLEPKLRAESLRIFLIFQYINGTYNEYLEAIEAWVQQDALDLEKSFEIYNFEKPFSPLIPAPDPRLLDAIWEKVKHLPMVDEVYAIEKRHPDHEHIGLRILIFVEKVENFKLTIEEPSFVLDQTLRELPWQHAYTYATITDKMQFYFFLRNNPEYLVIRRS